MVDGARAPIVPGTPAQQRLFLLLLLIAALLRFAPFVDLAYTHDELSALVRLYPTLAETIGKGVVGVDTHPPGVQVFLWAWTKLGGLGEAWVKLPFMLASLGALVLLHRIAARLADASVALVFTAVLATIQYTVLYGQLARPYAFGLFTTAWMADRLLAYRDRGGMGALFVIALAAALSAYVHHLAALQALLIGVSGLFLLPAERRRNHLIACAAAVAVYLPNLPVLRAQLAWKGLDEWLAPPTFGWFIEHARFITHWNGVFGVLLIVVVLWASARAVRTRDLPWTTVVIGLVWGALPYAITFAYSVWRAPVLQHSVVLFAFPYLLLLLLSGLKDIPARASSGLAIALALVATVTLMTTRRHFALNSSTHNRYEAIARGILDADEAGIPALVDAPAHILRFTFERWQVSAPPPYIDLTGLDAEAMDRVLDGLNTDRVFVGLTLQAPEGREAQLRVAFPFLRERHDMAEGQTFLLSARPHPGDKDDLRSSTTFTPEALSDGGWSVRPGVRTVHDTASHGLLKRWRLDGQEFGIAYEVPLAATHAMPYDAIEAGMDLAFGDTQATVVLDVEVPGGRRWYRTSDANERPYRQAALQPDMRWSELQQAQLKVYGWNRSRGAMRVASMNVKVRQGNPVRYAWLGPVRGEWTYR